MSKFLQSRSGQTPATELDEANRLTVSGLRSLIAGNFHLLQLGSRPGTPLEGISDCFLLLHEKGMFVLLQSHQNGIIHGEPVADNWTCFNYLGDGVPFENPLAQNRHNILRFSALLKLPEEDFHSCILFDNECELRRVPANSAGRSIIWADQVEQLFADLLPTLPARYSNTQLDALRDIFVLVSSENS
jgi:hypothetical protein